MDCEFFRYILYPAIFNLDFSLVRFLAYIPYTYLNLHEEFFPSYILYSLWPNPFYFLSFNMSKYLKSFTVIFKELFRMNNGTAIRFRVYAGSFKSQQNFNLLMEAEKIKPKTLN